MEWYKIPWEIKFFTRFENQDPKIFEFRSENESFWGFGVVDSWPLLAKPISRLFSATSLVPVSFYSYQFLVAFAPSFLFLSLLFSSLVFKISDFEMGTEL